MFTRDKILLFLIGLVVLGGVTSQTLMDGATALIALYFIFDLITKKTSFRKVFPLGIEWAFAGYFVVAVTGLALNGKPPVPWFFYLSKFNWILNLYILIYAFNHCVLNVKKWLTYFCIAFTLPNLYALVTYFARYDYISNTALNKGLIGMVNSATYHSHANSLILIFFATLFVFNYESLTAKLRATCLLAFLLMGTSIFFTFTRGIWLASFFSLLILFALYRRKWAIYFVATSVLGVLLLSLTSELVYLRIVKSFTGTTDYIRVQLIQVHWLMFKTHPWVGIGYWDSYRQIADYWPRMYLPPDWYESHAHNQIVSVLATTGALGAFFFGSFVTFFSVKALRFYRHTKLNFRIHTLAAAVVLLQIQFFLNCLTDVTFEYSKIRGLLVVGLAALVSFAKRTEQNELNHDQR